MRDDVDVEVDPALDAHLRDTLRAVAATIEPAAESSSRVVHLVPSPGPPHRRHRRWTAVAAAATVGITSGAGLMFLVDRDPDDASMAVDTQPPATVSVSAELSALAEQCESNVEASQVEIADHDPSPQPVPPDPADAAVLLFDTAAEPLEYTLIVVGDSEFYQCDVSSSTGQRAALLGDPNVITLPPTQPGPDEVQIVHRTSMTGADPYHGPGWVRLIGRAGDDVERIAIELPDGSTVDGDIQAGWFVLEAPLGDGVRDGEERVNWSAAGGAEHSSRADLLDPPDRTEACAADPDCVSSEVNLLLQSAQSRRLDEQAGILADLDVTDEEYHTAQLRFADCINASDYGVTVTVSEDGSMNMSGSDLDSASPDWEAQNEVQSLCAAAHLELVDEARTLLDAQQRISDD
jgi:hypothetical protein